MADRVAVKFGASVDCFGLEGGGMVGVGVLEAVDGAVGVLLQTPCAAEVDDLDAMFDGLRDPLAGLFVWGGEEEDLDAGVDDELPAEGKDFVGLTVTCDCELGMKVFEVRGGSGFGFTAAT